VDAKVPLLSLAITNRLLGMSIAARRLSISVIWLLIS
jgi:hypothetical protein